MKIHYIVISILALTSCRLHSFPAYDCSEISDSILNSIQLSGISDSDTGLELLNSKVDKVLDDLSANKLERAIALYCLAEQQSFSGNGAIAINLYTRSIEINNAHPLPYLSRAMIYEENSAYTKALQDLNAVLDMDKSLPLANLIKARIHLQLGNYEQAIIAIENEKSNAAGDVDYLTLEELRGDIYLASSQHDKAIAAYQAALASANKHSLWVAGSSPQFYPKQLSLYSKLIHAYCKAGMRVEAKSTFSDALERNAQATTISADCIRER